MGLLKIVDTAHQIAGKVKEIPQEPFTLFSLICNKAFGLG